MYASYTSSRPFPSTGRRSLIAFAALLMATLVLQSFPMNSSLASLHNPVADRLPTLPLAFEPNVGQTDAAVKMQTRALGGTASFTTQGVVLNLPDVTQPIVLEFKNALPTPSIVGGGQLPGVVNYLYGTDPTQWHTDVPTYESVIYQSLYPGINLQYDGKGGSLKGTYHVAPHVDPAQIGWRYDGAERLSIASNGDLEIALPGGKTLVEQAPIAWQDVDGQRTMVDARFTLTNGLVGFALGSYNAAHALTIDPALAWSTYLGGNNTDNAYGVAVDAVGNVYITGETRSNNFPVLGSQPRGGEYDAFVTKIDAAGTAILYSTYLGGTGDDVGLSIAVDGASAAYVSGGTKSANFPVANAYQSTYGGFGNYDVFITKLSPLGNSLEFSTYYGASGTEDGQGIALDPAGNIYVAGTAGSAFPTKNTLFPYRSGDAFALKVQPDGQNVLYATYVGGSGIDLGTNIAVDATGNAYVSGYTFSDDLATAGAFQTIRAGAADGFLTKINAAGTAIAYSTYLGGAQPDTIYDVAIDSAGNAYLTGETESITTFPTKNPLQPTYGGGRADSFVTKLNAAGNALVYSTFLGGSADDNYFNAPGAIAINAQGEAFVTGYTDSNNFPVVNAVQPKRNFGSDAFVSRVKADGSGLIMSTYYGGGGDEFGFDIAVDLYNNALLVGNTGSTDMPVKRPLQSAYGGVKDGFVAKYPGIRINLPLVAK